MPDPLPQVRRLTRAEYHVIGETGVFDRDRVELIHGIVVHKPMVGREHAYSVDQLNVLLVRRAGDRARVRVQQPVAAADDSEPEPDVAVVPPGTYLDDHPREAWLVIEVAKSSVLYDRTEKAALYAAMGVPEFWVVNLVEGVVEVFEAPGPEGYGRSRRARSGEVLSIAALPGVTIEVSEILPPR